MLEVLTLHANKLTTTLSSPHPDPTHARLSTLSSHLSHCGSKPRVRSLPACAGDALRRLLYCVRPAVLLRVECRMQERRNATSVFSAVLLFFFLGSPRFLRAWKEAPPVYQ